MHATLDACSLPPPVSFLQGGGRAGALLCSTDWSRSALGSPREWPQSLKSTLSLLLPSSAQMCLFWGSDLVAFYNDSYAPAIGDNHPAALGRPACEGWSALWEMLEPLLRDVQRSGVPFNAAAQLFVQNRQGFDEDTYFDVAYNPVRGEDGSVQGVLCIVSDQTRRIIDERRLNTLRVLSLRPVQESVEATATGFLEVLEREDRCDAPYALVYLRQRDGSLSLAASHGGMPAAGLRSVPAGDGAAPDRRLAALARVAATGSIESLGESHFVIDPPDAAADRQVLLPLAAGRDMIGVLVLAKNRRLAPNADYRRFSVLLAAQLSASLTNARMLSGERHRARALEQQVATALADREAAQQQLRQSQKMEAIGKLTGGVAHDFNNLLQVVGGNLQLLGRDVLGNERAERRIGYAMAGVARGAKLAAQLLAFSRRQPLEPKVVGIGRLIHGLDDMLRRSLGEAIEIETSIGGGLWNALIDPAQMENALLNLAINARDAMSGHGRLTIEAGNARLDDEYARQHVEVAAGQYVMVAVTDTGSGMSPEILEQVFEPFFSTKPEGKGTGLGLSMVYGFVKQSGGHIKIYSEPGHGTTVRLYLPRTMQDEDKPAAIETGPVQGGTETILVAEDDEGVRETVVATLGELGYRVLKARDAASALNVIDSGVPVDLLFTDVVMPGALRGPELAARARERVPGLAVLFTSGYTENAIVHGGRLDPGVELLSKPYSREALARKLRQVLGSRGQAAAAPGPSPAAPPAAPIPAGTPLTARLLVVEDDGMIRDSSTELLASHGASVAAAADAAAALAVLAAERIDVLVTDLGLPDLDGRELALRALQLQPGLGVVFATGEDGGDLFAGPLARAILLRKPYDEFMLVAAIRSSLKSIG